MSNAQLPWPAMTVPDHARRLIDQNCYQCDDRNGWATLYADLSCVGLLSSNEWSWWMHPIDAANGVSIRAIDPRDTLRGFDLYYDKSVRGWRVFFWCAT